MKILYDYYKGNKERCGFILKDGSIVELDNIHPEPTEGFEIDPIEILRYVDDLKAIWHTHPDSSSVLSGEDKLCMEAWPDLEHFIVGEQDISSYTVKHGAVISDRKFPR